MHKSDIRKQILKYMRYLEELQELHIFNDTEKERKQRDIKILKQKIKLLERKLNDVRVDKRQNIL